MRWLVTIILACLLQSNVFADEVDLHEIAYACIESAAVDPDIIGSALGGDISESDELKLFLACFFEKVGIMKEGEFDFVTISENLQFIEFPTIEDPQKAMENCRGKDFSGSTVGDTALNGFKCFMGV